MTHFAQPVRILSMEHITVRVEKSGRIVIPAAIRKRLNLKAGSHLLLRIDQTGLEISTREQALARIRERLGKYIPANRNLSEELLLERREEASAENGT